MERQYAEDIRNQTAQIVSDGSYARGQSSAAFVTQHTHRLRHHSERSIRKIIFMVKLQSQDTRMNKIRTEANLEEYWIV